MSSPGARAGAGPPRRVARSSSFSHATGAPRNPEVADASIPVGPPQGKRENAAAPRGVVPDRQAHVERSDAGREREARFRSARGGAAVADGGAALERRAGP